MVTTSKQQGRDTRNRWGGRRRWWGVVAVGAVVVALVVVAGLVGGTGSPGPGPVLLVPPTTAPQGADAVRLSALPPVQASSDPEQVAVAWLRAYRTARYDDPPDAWVARVRPVVTPALAALYSRSQEGGAGAGWARRVASRCDSAVEAPVAVVPAEAPRTADMIYVQVAGTLRTWCAATAEESVTGGAGSTAEPAPVEALAATLQMQRGQDGRWRVAARLQ